MSKSEFKGRPRSANLKDIQELEERIATMVGADRTLRAEFFGRIIAAAVGTMGHMAFSDDFLESLVNNAENVWNAYKSILDGEREKKLVVQVEEARAAAAEAEKARKAAVDLAARAMEQAKSVGVQDPELTDGIEGDDLYEEDDEDAPSESEIIDEA